MSLIDDPMVQSALIPLAASMLLAWVLGRVNVKLAAAAVPLAWVLTYVVIVGMPTDWPRGAEQKLVWLGALGLILGVALHEWSVLGGWTRYVGSSVVRVATGLAVLWIAWPGIGGAFTASLVLRVMLAAVVATSLLHRASNRGLDAPLMLLVAAIAIAPIALFGGSAKYAQLAGAAAAGLGGFLLLSGPSIRYPFDMLGIAGIGLPLAGITSVVALYLPDVAVPALWTWLAIFLASEEWAQIPGVERIPGPVWSRLAFLVVCAIPATVAVWTAYALFPGESPY